MAAKVSEFFEPTIDLRYSMLTNKVVIDSSNAQYNIMRYNPNTGSVNGSYNSAGMGEVYFQISNSTDYIDLLGLSLMVTGHAETSLGVHIDPDTCFIPWNTASALIDTIRIRINGASEPIEVYSSPGMYSYANLFRTLNEWSSTAIEGRSDIFFTPCMEEDCMQAGAGVTDDAVSIERSNRWLSTDDNITHCTKLLPLTYLFSSLGSCPGFLKANKVELFVNFKKQDNILFQKTADLSTNLYIIEDTQLIFQNTGQSPFQNALNLQDSLKNETQKLCFEYYDTMSFNYLNSTTMYQNNLLNAQSVIAAFPATILPKCINKYNFTLNNITNVSATLGGKPITATPVQCDILYPQKNTELYNLYLQLTKNHSIKFPPSLQFETAYGASVNGTVSDMTYNLFCFPFQQAMTPVLSEARDLKIYLTQSATGSADNYNVNCSAIICIIRTQTFEICADGTIIKTFQ